MSERSEPVSGLGADQPPAGNGPGDGGNAAAGEELGATVAALTADDIGPARPVQAQGRRPVDGGHRRRDRPARADP
jgi:hypothetical protein